ncbi:aspartate aminotransferase family protein [Candidatus Korarchaeum cryptofilum]|nr:glutamate-1-semialdehyde 2,1-aminomutase [Candidatus Korarchaeum cryptofilum]
MSHMRLDKVPASELELFKKRTPKSGEIFEEVSGMVPFGVNSNYRYADPYPIYMKRAKGSRIWDVDGNEYIDFNMAFGALGIGHSHPKLVEAIEEKIEEGTIFGFEFDEMLDLAKIIKARYKVDMMKFQSTGLEATFHALRIARAFTGRKKIVKFEGCYHGSHDFLLVSVKPSKYKAGHPVTPNQVPGSQGVLEDVVKHTLVAQFNNLESVEKIMRQHGNDVAAIILEPIPMNMGFVIPKPGFLEGLRSICDEYNCLLIFDEIKTGGKFYSGAAGYFKVRPDLMTLGKAIAGGFPLSVVAGKKEIMQSIVPGVVSHAGTFNANPVAIRAGLVTLRDILTEEALSYASRLGEELAKGYLDIIKDEGIEATVQYIGVSGSMVFAKDEVVDWRSFQKVDVGKWWLFMIAMMNRGVLPNYGPDEQWTVSTQHTKEDIETTIEKFKEVAKIIKRVELELPLVEAV